MRVRQALLKAFSAFKIAPEDISVPTGSQPGEDIWFSPAFRELFPFSMEMKNVEKISIWKALEQAKKNADGYDFLLAFSRNRSPIFVCVELDVFLGAYARMRVLQRDNNDLILGGLGAVTKEYFEEGVPTEIPKDKEWIAPR